MKKTENVSVFTCLWAVVLAIGFSAAGVVVAVVLNILLRTVGGFLCGIKYVGIVFELIGDFIYETFIGDLVYLAAACVVGFGAGAAWQKALPNEKQQDTPTGAVAGVLCFLVGMAATFLTHLLLYTYDAYLLTDGALGILGAFQAAPRLYVYSPRVHVVLMILYRIVVVFVNTIVGFWVATSCLDFDEKQK